MSTKAQIPAAHAARTSSVKRTARFAYAAGVAAVLANLFLIAFFALQASHPEDGTSLGSANDLVGSLSTALMIPSRSPLPHGCPRGARPRLPR